MRVLLTNNMLAQRGGSELYLYDVARALRDRGHAPVAFSTVHGAVADELRAASIPVVDDLSMLAEPPDVIHGQHHLETLTALLQFPHVPAVYFRHGLRPWEESVPRFPRILHYVTVNARAREVLAMERGISLERITFIPNFVDLRRFVPREPLPEHPRRALIFSNYASDSTHVPAVREACARAGIDLDVVGFASGNPTAQPHAILPQYDLVFAIGRSAIEALAVGAAVVLCDADGVGAMVTSAELDGLRSLNFGLPTLIQPLQTGAVLREIERYSAADASRVSRLVRASAGLDVAVDRIVELYERVIADQQKSWARPSPEEESRAASAYLRWLNPYIKQRVVTNEGEPKDPPREAILLHRHLQEQLQSQQVQLTGIYRSKTWRAMSVYWRCRDKIRTVAQRAM